MQLSTRNWAALFALGATLMVAWLASASTADAASSKFHITSYKSDRALELTPGGTVIEAPSNPSSPRQQWIQRNQPGGTALWENAAGFPAKACLAAPPDATPTSTNKVVIRSCFSSLDKRLHWTRNTGVPFNAGVWMFNAHTGQTLVPEICIVGPCSNDPSLLPGHLAEAFGTFAEWRFKFLGTVL
jgi:hypothetical protein